MQLLPSALRALSAALLADCKCSRQPHSGTHALCLKLLAHPRASVFLDVLFDATRTLYRKVSACLHCTAPAIWKRTGSAHFIQSCLSEAQRRQYSTHVCDTAAPEQTCRACSCASPLCMA